MKCPFCQDMENKVIDSRMSKDGLVIRRRRECLECGRRFTTYERIEEVLPLVIKKDGRREPFDRMKIIIGLKKACEKRPISITVLEKIAEKIELKVQESGDKEIPSSVVGEAIMQELFKLDHVAYVRFASVYRSFKDAHHFMEELRDLLQRQKEEAKKQV
ncbi:MAG TPA: transcriptional regulator NrdR [bacterium]|nr:transcriptional regulator NrdR [bacterium]